MKLGLICLAALSLVACAAHTPPPKPPPPMAADTDCVKVYDNLIAINVRANFGDPEKLDPVQRMVAQAIVESYFQQSGAAEKFFTSCMKTANTDQTNCMATAPTIDAVRDCAKKYETKKSP
jgi:hypothetical protein